MAMTIFTASSSSHWSRLIVLNWPGWGGADPDWASPALFDQDPHHLTVVVLASLVVYWKTTNVISNALLPSWSTAAKEENPLGRIGSASVVAPQPCNCLLKCYHRGWSTAEEPPERRRCLDKLAPLTWSRSRIVQDFFMKIPIFLGMGPEDKVQAGMTIPGLDFQGIFFLPLQSVLRWYFRSSWYWDRPEKAAIFKAHSKKLSGMVCGT